MYMEMFDNKIILMASQLLCWQALLAEGRFYSDLELTEKEIERMVMEASRAEYLADDSYKQQLGHRESSTSSAEPSSSGASKFIYLSMQDGSSPLEYKYMINCLLFSSSFWPPLHQAVRPSWKVVESVVYKILSLAAACRWFCQWGSAICR
jgi:hypothetical protein